MCQPGRIKRPGFLCPEKGGDHEIDNGSIGGKDHFEGYHKKQKHKNTNRKQDRCEGERSFSV